MKRILFLCIILCFSTIIYAENKVLLMATTTSTDNTGLLDYIQKKAEHDLGIHLRWIAVGTGQALKHGENCDADLLLVHAEKEEKEFMKKGYGIKRVQFMYNDFILLGPVDDPLKISDLSIKKAFKMINNSKKAKFISRGDNSGTHIKEKELWIRCCNQIPSDGAWYIENGRGMMETILMADELKGYTLADRSTYLMFKNKIKDHQMKIISEGDPSLRNPYSIIIVNPEKCPNVKIKDAERFVQWLLSKETLQYIEKYSINGEKLFKINYN